MPPKKKKRSGGKKKPRAPMDAEQQAEMLRRTPLPREGQILGICERRVGGSRMFVRCLDGKTRVCRIPGRLKRRLWVREGDVLLIKPWEIGGDEKGDVVYKYRPFQADYLRRRGHLKTIEDVDEF